MPAPPFTSKARTGRLPEPDPPPPLPSPGRTVRVAARVVLWTLIGIASLRGILPPSAAPGESRSLDTPARSSLDLDPLRSRPQASVQDQIAIATAAAFLREYLTVDGPRRLAGRGPGTTGRVAISEGRPGGNRLRSPAPDSGRARTGRRNGCLRRPDGQRTTRVRRRRDPEAGGPSHRPRTDLPQCGAAGSAGSRHSHRRWTGRGGGAQRRPGGAREARGRCGSRDPSIPGRLAARRNHHDPAPRAS